VFNVWLRHLLLAVFLLTGQVGAPTHVIAHLADYHHEHHAEGEPEDPFCGECLAYGHHGAGAPAEALAWSEPGIFVPAAFAARPNPERFPTPAYLSRAPPGFSL